MDRQRDALREGTRLAGYVIGRVLGRGGFGITYHGAKYLFPEVKVAIKEFMPRGHAMRSLGADTVHATDPEEFEQALAGLEAEAWDTVAALRQNARSAAGEPATLGAKSVR